MKLIDILLENTTKKEYIESLKKTFGDNISIKKSKDSDILYIKIYKENKDEPESFEKLVNNSFIRNITSPKDISILEKIKTHDEVFSKKNQLKIKG